MKLLLDTHFVVWLLNNPSRLRPNEAEMLRAPDAEIFVSSLTLWEMRLKWSKRHASGERKGEVDAAAALEFVQAAPWTLLPLSAEDAAAELRDPLLHYDPFGEQLLIQTQQLGGRLLTRDRNLLGIRSPGDLTRAI